MDLKRVIIVIISIIIIAIIIFGVYFFIKEKNIQKEAMGCFPFGKAAHGFCCFRCWVPARSGFAGQAGGRSAPERNPESPAPAAGKAQ